MRYLAIDLGGKRTGLAAGDDETRIASPVGVIECPAAQGARLLDELAAAIREHAPDALILGLPLNMDDSEGPAAKAARVFGDTLAARVGLPVHYQDERLTTADADWSLAGSGLTRKQKKTRRDAIAAAAILQDFLDGLPRPPHPLHPPEQP